MGKVYVGQTAVTLIATLTEDITGATCKIKYIKPSGSEGSFVAAITTANPGVISYVVTSPNDLNESGVWTFWGYAVFSDLTYAAGEPYSRQIYVEGK